MTWQGVRLNDHIKAADSIQEIQGDSFKAAIERLNKRIESMENRFEKRFDSLEQHIRSLKK